MQVIVFIEQRKPRRRINKNLLHRSGFLGLAVEVMIVLMGKVGNARLYATVFDQPRKTTPHLLLTCGGGNTDSLLLQKGNDDRVSLMFCYWLARTGDTVLKSPFH